MRSSTASGPFNFRTSIRNGSVGLLLSVFSAVTAAHDPVEEIIVTGRGTNLVGDAQTASEGLVGQAEIARRPLLRAGEIMELVPGMVATQHSGSGKANQYFLRGFNLDHGTDFATFIDYMPVNMRTHAHGQGYTDLNFLIPEVIDHLAYRKGPYYAEVGDFSGAGSAHLTTARSLEHGRAQLTAGEDSYWRVLVADSAMLSGGGDFLYALEAQRYDGPWTDVEEGVKKYSALLKYSRRLGDGRLSMSFMGYDNAWDSADQIPRRAVASGLIGELGSIDRSLGGESSRHSIGAAWESVHWTLAAYAIDYDLSLTSNFTYFLDDPVNGDRFEQVDHRRVYGGTVRYSLDTLLAGRQLSHSAGLDTRLDAIDEVSLYKIVDRASRLGAVRSDAVDELSLGLYWQSQYHWTRRLRSTLGGRYDHYDFEVNPRVLANVNGVDLSTNRGQRNDGMVSLKGTLAYAFNDHWEAYAAAGQGFHSNDARGTLTHIDPADGSRIAPVDPLVRSWGAELGARAYWTNRLNASLALWTLRLDSELLFVGDAGNTEASRASERRGAELTAYYRLNDLWSMDLEYSWTDAQFEERDPLDPSLGDHIPGAVKDVLQAGLSVQHPRGSFGSLRLRFFGPRPLDENDAARSKGSTVVNLLAGHHWERFTLKAEVLNLLDSNDHDIDYFYASRLPGESANGTADLHYHVMEPRTFRITVALGF